MTDWRPIPPPSIGQGRRLIDSVRIEASGTLAISEDLVHTLGDSQYVAPLVNGHPHLVGLKAATRGPRSFALKVMNRGRTGHISGRNIVAQAGKSFPERTTHLPHHWDGDVLVIDLSGLPDAPGGR